MQQTRQAVTLQVKQRYYDLLMAEKTLTVAESSQAALAAHEADTQRFHDNGLVPLNDLLNAQVALADAVRQQHRATAGVKDVRCALNLLIGKDYDHDIRIIDQTPTMHLPPELNTQIKQALAARPEVAVLKQSIQSKQNEQLIAKSDYYPRIDLLGKYQQDGDNLGAGNNDYSNQYNSSLGVQSGFNETATWNL